MDDRSVFVVQEGDADRHVLMLHGFPESSFELKDVVMRVAAHAQVTAFDFIGYGLSDKPRDPRATIFDQADLTERIAEDAGIDRCVLVAHDMGDTVAAELLARQNDGRLSFIVDRTILTNGSIFMHLVQLSPGQQLLLQLPDEPLAQSLPLDGFRAGIAETFSNEHQPSDETVEAMLALIAHNNGDRLLPRLIRYVEERRANQERWTAALVNFAGPMTALWGEQDPIAVVAMAHHLKEIRPDTEVVTWPDVGHWPAIEAPDRVASEIIKRL